MITPYEGSPLAYDYAVRPNQWVTLRDGTRLATDVYLPALGGRALEGAFPVVLERTPYDKTRTWHSITARFFARRGYAAVVQDVRGRHASKGEFYFPHYDVNPNTGEPLGLERRFTVAHQSVFHDAAHPSHIVLPIIPPDRGKEA